MRIKIPQKLRQEVWLKTFGKRFEGKCPTKWCSNTISVFNFEVAHNVPVSKGGKNTLTNLHPLCSGCNRSMSNIFTIDEWNLLY